MEIRDLTPKTPEMEPAVTSAVMDLRQRVDRAGFIAVELEKIADRVLGSVSQAGGNNASPTPTRTGLVGVIQDEVDRLEAQLNRIGQAIQSLGSQV